MLYRVMGEETLLADLLVRGGGKHLLSPGRGHFLLKREVGIQPSQGTGVAVMEGDWEP